MTKIKRIAINTGGGDAPGLNAVIRAAVLSALHEGWEVYGIRNGYEGLLEDDGLIELDEHSVSGITHRGGTILGTSNRGNPLEYPIKDADGNVRTVDRSDEVVDQFRRKGLDALIAIGGDGSLYIANALAKKGLPVIGVPKTIDNDLDATLVTFGFHTAVQTASDAIDKLHSTAESHQRVMVVELMGRNTGWIALFAGVAGTADVILIPEIPYDIESVARKVEERYAYGPRFAIVVVAEGAKPRDGKASFVEGKQPGRAARYGGIAEQVAAEIQEATGRETRSLVLGHLQRGGQPTAYDRILSLRFGAAAVRLAAAGKFGCMTALVPPNIAAVPLDEALGSVKGVPLDGDLMETARCMEVCFGD
jgi:6-phosphofructokinase 1